MISRAGSGRATGSALRINQTSSVHLMRFPTKCAPPRPPGPSAGQPTARAARARVGRGAGGRRCGGAAAVCCSCCGALGQQGVGPVGVLEIGRGVGGGTTDDCPFSAGSCLAWQAPSSPDSIMTETPPGVGGAASFALHRCLVATSPPLCSLTFRPTRQPAPTRTRAGSDGQAAGPTAPRLGIGCFGWKLGNSLLRLFRSAHNRASAFDASCCS